MIGEYGFVIYQNGEFAGTCNSWEEAYKALISNNLIQKV